MTVNELIETLRQYPGDAEVALWNGRDDEYCDVGSVAYEVTDLDDSGYPSVVIS